MTLVRGLYAHAAVDGLADSERSLARAGMSQLRWPFSSSWPQGGWDGGTRAAANPFGPMSLLTERTGCLDHRPG